MKSFHFLKSKYIKDLPVENYRDDLFDSKKSVGDFWNYINSYEPPLVVGVYDSWGSGKSSFLRLLSNESKDNFLIFEAWKYKGKIDLWKALTLEISRKWTDEKYQKDINDEFYYEKTLSFISRNNTVIVLVVFVMLFSISYILSENFKFTTLLSILGTILTIIVLLTDKLTKREVNSYEEFEHIYKNISKKIKSKKYIILEDLDRCIPEVAVSLLEDTKGFFKDENSNFIFILPLDLSLLEGEIKKRYDEKEINPQEYLDKIIDLPYNLPYRDENLKNYISSILSKEGLKRLEEDFKKISNSSQNNDFIDFIDEIFRYNGNNSPRKIKKIFLSLDFAFHINRNEKEINSVTLLILILIQLEYKIVYELLRRISNYELYCTQKNFIDKKDFLFDNSQRNNSRKDKDIKYRDVASCFKVRLSTQEKDSKAYKNFFELNKFENFIEKCNSLISNPNKRDKFIPKNVETLKKYIYSTESVTVKEPDKDDVELEN